MNRTAAESIDKTMRDVSAAIDGSIRLVRDNSSDEEFTRYRRVAGKLMGEIFIEILQPIYSEYPDLPPTGLQPPDTQ